MANKKKAKPHTQVEVDSLPPCDFCTGLTGYRGQRAAYDVLVPLYGSWANVCEFHFRNMGCKLGLGAGQKLILRTKAGK